MKIDFDPKKLIEDRIGKITPTKVILALAAFVIVVNVLSLIIGIFQALLPVAVLAVAGYFGYQMLQSRQASDAARSAQSTQTAQAQADPERTIVLEEAAVQRQKAAARRLAEEAETVVAAAEEAEQAPRRLSVEEQVNPATGLREANLAQLEAMEQEKLRQTSAADADAVKAALEERKRRLLGGQ